MNPWIVGISMILMSSTLLWYCLLPCDAVSDALQNIMSIDYASNFCQEYFINPAKFCSWDVMLLLICNYEETLMCDLWKLLINKYKTFKIT